MTFRKRTLYPITANTPIHPELRPLLNRQKSLGHHSLAFANKRNPDSPAKAISAAADLVCAKCDGNLAAFCWDAGPDHRTHLQVIEETAIPCSSSEPKE